MANKSLVVQLLCIQICTTWIGIPENTRNIKMKGGETGENELQEKKLVQILLPNYKLVTIMTLSIHFCGQNQSLHT